MAPAGSACEEDWALEEKEWPQLLVLLCGQVTTGQYFTTQAAACKSEYCALALEWQVFLQSRAEIRYFVAISPEMGWLLNCAAGMVPIRNNSYMMMKTTFVLCNDKFGKSLHRYCMSGMYLEKLQNSWV